MQAHGYEIRRIANESFLTIVERSFITARGDIMDGKVIVVTGALGALGSVVVDSALARGAKVASVDHAPTQVPATSNQFELGGVDLTDAAAARKAIDISAPTA